MMDGRRLIKKAYEVDQANAGIVIGKRGKGIGALKEIQGVCNIFFRFRGQILYRRRQLGFGREQYPHFFHPRSTNVSQFYSHSKT